jgi:hypothetical protein
MPIPRLARLAVVLVAGCAAAGEPSAPATAVVAKGSPRCSPQDCGTHSKALMECSFWWELNSDGLPNDNGAQIVSVHRADGTAIQLTTDGDRLVGIDPATHAVLAAHLGLTDTVIVVVVGGVTRTLQIVHVALAEEHFWVGAQDSIEGYDIVYTPLVDPLVPKKTRVIVFGKDRYEPVDKLVSVGPGTDGWMNFACKGGIVYEMHALGRTTAAQAPLGITTTLSERQSLLNAVTMNACGTGTSFTTLAEPITLSESQHLLPPTSPLQAMPVTYEAIWGPGGAVCLNVPRLANNAMQVGPKVAAIAAECGAALPTCSPAQLADFPSSGDVVTGNPAGSSP